MFGSLIDYWYYTGDSTYNDKVSQALLFQVGPDENYMPPNQSKSLGNDDQAFWGMAAMSAAEVKFPNPPKYQPQWLALAQAVFNSQAERWDTTTCNGGLRWQIFAFNNGYEYKNSVSNGCFFNLAARLGAYTHNSTYLDWAIKAWDWCWDSTLIGDRYQVFDGTGPLENCTGTNPVQWSYNTGVFLLGVATMWNQVSGIISYSTISLLTYAKTEGAEQLKWEERLNGLLNASVVFFNKSQVMYEVSCEPRNNCDIDQQSFKAYLARWMAATTKLAPWTWGIIQPYLIASANAAALSCNPGETGAVCGTKWTTGAYDGSTGVGQQMNAMEVIQSNLIQRVSGPVSNTTGGSSQGDPSAGTGTGHSIGQTPRVITTGDRAGAGVLTALVLVCLVSGAWYVRYDEFVFLLMTWTFDCSLVIAVLANGWYLSQFPEETASR